jgi:hypothetical protein
VEDESVMNFHKECYMKKGFLKMKFLEGRKKGDDEASSVVI